MVRRQEECVLNSHFVKICLDWATVLHRLSTLGTLRFSRSIRYFPISAFNITPTKYYRLVPLAGATNLTAAYLENKMSLTPYIYI